MPIPPTPLLLGNVVYSVNGAGLGRLKVESSAMQFVMLSAALEQQCC